MELKKVLPIANSSRFQIRLQKNLLTKRNNLVKVLFKEYKVKRGRSSSTGHITVRHKSNGCKYKLHIINSLDTYFGLNICNMYNSNQNAFVSLNFDLLAKSFFKTTSTAKVFPGCFIISHLEIKDKFVGCRMQLKFLPVGSIIHSISFNNNIIYSSSAGSFCQLIEKKSSCKVRLPSGKIIKLFDNCFATLGTISNNRHKSICIAKAGRNRLLGVRPGVRGIAMNPVDHPHGGRTNGGRPSVTPWGIPTKGKPTVKKIL